MVFNCSAMINFHSIPRVVLFFLFVGSYVLAPLSLIYDFPATWFGNFLLAGMIFLTLYFATYCFSYISIKRNRN